MEKKQPPPPQKVTEPQAGVREGYHEPLLIKHEQLRDITGFKYGEKNGQEKSQAE